MKKILLALMICCAATACKKNHVDFTYSPEYPTAGQSVQFSNLSYKGKTWSWTYGDGAVSGIKNPSHIYKEPGTYRVTLKVDGNKSWTATKEITVFDTIPTYVESDTAFSVYTDYTFTAQVYNPYNSDVSYFWYQPIDPTMYIPPYFVITDDSQDSKSLHLFFTRALEEAPIGLRVILGGDTTYIVKYFDVEDRATNSLLVRTDENDYRQRIFGPRAEPYHIIPADPMLNAEQDTLQIYNDSTFRLSDLAATFPGIQGFHIAYRKIYYRANGLWVANIDGAYPVQIEEKDCSAMTLDMKDNRIYWATAEGVWYMPFVGSDNNKFVTVPAQLNTLTGITKLAADNTLRWKN